MPIDTVHRYGPTIITEPVIVYVNDLIVGKGIAIV